MWRFFNWMLGWHYVEYRDSATMFVARVVETPSGRLRMVNLFRLRVYDAFLKEGGTFEGTSGRWLPLTWKEPKDLT